MERLSTAALLSLACLFVLSLVTSDLRAAEQPPAAPAPAPAAKEQAKPRPISIRVLDAQSHQPIEKFRVVAGVRAGSVTEDFKKRTGFEIANWQPHTVRAGSGGELLWPAERSYDEMILRVEADGYKPQTTGWMKKAELPETIEMLFVADPGIEGRVVESPGKSVAGAKVLMTLAQRDVNIDDGKIRGEEKPPESESDRWRRPVSVVTDADGRFRLPTETDPGSAVLVMHESGVREMATAEFQKQPEITLRPWGRIEGQVLWGDKPGASEKISLSCWRDEYGYPGMIYQSGEATSDAEGRFVFDKVLPGGAQISKFIKLPKKGEFGATSATFDGLHMHVKVSDAGATKIILGGKGRLAVGKLKGRDSWEGATFHFHPNAPRPGDDDMCQAFGMFQASEIGPLFFQNKLKPNADGSFVIPRMLPGDYQLFVQAPGVENYAGSARVVVPPESPDEELATLDLGEIKVAPPQPGKGK